MAKNESKGEAKTEAKDKPKTVITEPEKGKTEVVKPSVQPTVYQVPANAAQLMDDLLSAETVQLSGEAATMKCGCCGALWHMAGNTALRPGCACALYGACLRCGKCSLHCDKHLEKKAEVPEVKTDGQP